MDYEIPEILMKKVNRIKDYIDGYHIKEGKLTAYDIYEFLNLYDLCSGLTEFVDLLILLGIYYPEAYGKIER